MYVISLARWRRRFGPWMRTLIIAVTVLWALFVAYRWLTPKVPAGPPFHPDVHYTGRGPAGEFSPRAERFSRLRVAPAPGRWMFSTVAR